VAVIKVLIGLLSVVLGLLSFQLTAWTDSSFNSAPFQFGCAGGAVLVGVWTYWRSRTPYPGRVLAIGAAFIGIAYLAGVRRSALAPLAEMIRSSGTKKGRWRVRRHLPFFDRHLCSWAVEFGPGIGGH
jgi:hypothetical protein